MKSYINGQQLKLVGKAWEIRHYLRKMLEQGGQELLLSEYISERSSRIEPARQKADKQPIHFGKVIPFPLS